MRTTPRYSPMAAPNSTASRSAFHRASSGKVKNTNPPPHPSATKFMDCSRTYASDRRPMQAHDRPASRRGCRIADLTTKRGRSMLILDTCDVMRLAGAGMNRRGFLRLSAGAALLLPGPAVRAVGAEGGPRRLIVIFLRGAIDGLNVVVPHDEQRYYESRPTIAIGRPGTDQGVLPLDGHFGLHPALASLLPLWNDRKLAF